MSNQQQCIDFYGERLKVGNKVIPMFEEALFIGIGGVISKYVYSLVFFDNKLIPKTTLPLTNKTDVDYELLFSFKTKGEFLNGL